MGFRSQSFKMLALTLLVSGGVASGAFAAMQARGGAMEERELGPSGTARPDAHIAYGNDPLQAVDLYLPPRRVGDHAGNAPPPPIAVFVHGGGWARGNLSMVAQKPEYFARAGWAFASIGYRLVPNATVEQEAADVGMALQRLRAEAAARGYDGNRILLFGHSAGAHLVSLVGTDPQYAGDAFGAIRGVIPIDGAAYDVPRQLASAGQFMLQRTYIPAFGSDVARQRALSPTNHVGAPDAPDWLFLYDAQRADAVDQAELLAGSLRRDGARVATLAMHYPERQVLARHRRINVDFGTPDYAANVLVAAMMARVAAGN